MEKNVDLDISSPAKPVNSGVMGKVRKVKRVAGLTDIALAEIGEVGLFRIFNAEYDKKNNNFMTKFPNVLQRKLDKMLEEAS